jgi:hypothetical protein
MIQMPQVKTSFFAFKGGLDQVTPPLEAVVGSLRSAANVEIGVNNGYARLGGYERFSGKARPSSATYAILTCTIAGSVSLGDVLTDNAGTTFGTVIALPTGQAVLTLITGTFSAGNIKVSGVVVGTCTGAQESAAAATPALNATYLNLAADAYRALIGVVPGSGSILGVHIYNGHVYAFRNNAGGTAAVMHVDSPSGWSAITLFNEVSFTAGSGVATIIDGGTLTQGGVTSTIKRVVVQSGTLAAGNAVGRLIITNPAGGNFAAGAATVGAGTLTLSGIQTAITMLPGGRFEFDNWNFGGGTSTKRMYGADGVNRGFEFDGTTLVPIVTGMTADTPLHVRQHKSHLFFAFGGSAQHSAIGDPYNWSVVSGANELACGDTISGFVELTGTATSGALAIYTRNRTSVLYGNSSADWNLVHYEDEAGALPYTLQFVTQGVVLDDKGITLLSTTQNYGNFANAVASAQIKPLLNDLTSLAVSSCIVRQKNQYRVFFSTGDAVYVTFKDGKILGMTPATLPDPVLCITSLEGSTGREEIYFGSSDGYVYQMDIGTSFDGDPIAWSAELAFNHFGSPRTLKSFKKAVTEVTGGDYSEFYFSYQLGYGSSEYDSPEASTSTSDLTSSNWDSGNWDALFWDGRSLTPSESDITGTAENISLVYSGSSDEFQPFTLNGAIVHFTPRRNLR